MPDGRRPWDPMMLEDFDLRGFDHVARLFPLPGVVLFPHAVLPLHIFEPRYRQMTADALAGDGLIAIVQARPGTWREGDEPELEPVACLGQIVNSERLPDGRYNFLLLGRKRIRLVRELDRPTFYRQAEVEILEDIEPGPGGQLLSTELNGLFRDMARERGVLDKDLEGLLRSKVSLGVLTDLVAHALGLPAPVKQGLLDEPRIVTRAEVLIRILREQFDPTARKPPFPPPFSVN